MSNNNKRQETKKFKCNPPTSLKAKVIISVIIILALTLGLLITFLVYRTIHFYKQNFIHRGIALINGVCGASKIPLLVEDAARLQRMAKTIQARSKILYIIYFDPEGHIITMSVRNKAIKQIINKAKLARIPKDIIKHASTNNNIKIIKYNIKNF